MKMNELGVLIAHGRIDRKIRPSHIKPLPPQNINIVNIFNTSTFLRHSYNYI